MKKHTFLSAIFCFTVILYGCNSDSGLDGGQSSSGGSGGTGSTEKTLNFTWTAPQTRENGEALAAEEISGYQVWIKQLTPRVNEEFVTFNKDQTQGIYTVFSEGNYTFQIATIDSDGVSIGEYSEPMPITVTFE